MRKIFITFCLMAMMAVSSFSLKAQDRQYVEAVKEYLEVSNAKQTMITTLVETYESMKLPVTNVGDMTREIIEVIWPGYTEDMAKVMYKYYTIDDLRQIIDFYKTPAGRKFAEYSPAAAKEATQMMSKYAGQIQTVVSKYLKFR